MPRPALPLFRPVLPRLVAWVGAQAGFATVLAAWVGAQADFATVLAAWASAQAGVATVLAAWVGAQAGFATVLAAWIGAQAGFATVSGLGRCRGRLFGGIGALSSVHTIPAIASPVST